MSQQQHGVIRADSVRRIAQPAFVADGGAATGGGMTVVPIVEDGVVAGIQVRCRCGESVLIECDYDGAGPGPRAR
jgi:hypothetical protein